MWYNSVKNHPDACNLLDPIAKCCPLFIMIMKPLCYYIPSFFSDKGRQFQLQKNQQISRKLINLNEYLIKNKQINKHDNVNL